MAMPFMTIKKIGMFLMLGLIPLIFFLIGLMIGLPLYYGAVISIGAALLLTIIVWKFTDSPFLRIYEGASYGVLTIDSYGKIDLFDVSLKGENIVGDHQGQPIKQPFHRNLFFYVSDKINKGRVSEDTDNVTFTLPKTDYSQALSRTDKPFFVYSRVLNRFITKEYLANNEKDAMILNFGYQYNQELKEFNKAASGITRIIVDLIRKGIKGQGSFLLWFVVILVVIFLMWQFGPTIMAVFDSAGSAATGSTTGLLEKLG